MNFEVLINKDYGMDDLEIYTQIIDKNEIYLTGDHMATYNKSKLQGAGIRVFKDNKYNFGYTTFSKMGDIDHTIRFLSGQVLSYGVASDYYLPSKIEIKGRSLEYDQSLKEMNYGDKIEILNDMRKIALSSDVKISNIPQLVWNDVTLNTSLHNSNGVSYSTERTIIFIYFSIVASSGLRNEKGFGATIANTTDKLSPFNTINKLSSYVVKMLDAKRYSSHKGPIIFSQLAGAKLLKCFWSAFVGQKVINNESFLSGLQGQKISSSNVCLIDDGYLKGGTATTPVDAEGVLTEKTEIIQHGQLSDFLFDYSTARKYGYKPTGNTFRPDYRSEPKVGPSNFYLKPGELSFEKIINDVFEGIYITNIFNLYTGVTVRNGDFSLSAEGFHIEKGVLGSAVKFAIQGNFLQLLNNISLVGDDLYFDPICEGFGSPTFVVDNLNLIG